jgi:hypothetical protein
MIRIGRLAFAIAVAVACRQAKQGERSGAATADPPIRAGCHIADGSSAHYERVIQQTVSDARLRKTFRLEATSPEEVSLVRDPAVCERAGEALASEAVSSDSTSTGQTVSFLSPHYVFRVGNSYAVVDPGVQSDSDCDFMWFFDSSWKNFSVAC